MDAHRTGRAVRRRCFFCTELRGDDRRSRGRRCRRCRSGRTHRPRLRDGPRRRDAAVKGKTMTLKQFLFALIAAISVPAYAKPIEADAELGAMFVPGGLTADV